MRDYLTLGPTPPDEDCAQLGKPDYYANAQADGKRYIALLRTCFGDEPFGAHLRIQGFDHDFGKYYEVVCVFDNDFEAAVAYAYRLEDEGPLTWNDTTPRLPVAA